MTRLFRPRLRKASRVHRRRAGAAVTEFAMVAPFLVIFALGAIDVGQGVNVAQLVNDASREGARTASRADVLDVSEVESTVQNYLQDSFSSSDGGSLSDAVNVSVSDADGNALGGDLTTVDSGDPITVTVTFDYESVRWTVGFPGLTDATMSTTTIMRRE